MWRKILFVDFGDEFRIRDGRACAERSATLTFASRRHDLIAFAQTFCALSAFCWSVAMICKPVTDS